LSKTYKETSDEFKDRWIQNNHSSKRNSSKYYSIESSRERKGSHGKRGFSTTGLGSTTMNGDPTNDETNSMAPVDPEQVDQFLDNNSSDLENGMDEDGSDSDAKEGQNTIDK
jgi:hypothetical protein